MPSADGRRDSKLSRSSPTFSFMPRSSRVAPPVLRSPAGGRPRTALPLEGDDIGFARSQEGFIGEDERRILAVPPVLPPPRRRVAHGAQAGAPTAAAAPCCMR